MSQLASGSSIFMLCRSSSARSGSSRTSIDLFETTALIGTQHVRYVRLFSFHPQARRASAAPDVMSVLTIAISVPV